MEFHRQPYANATKVGSVLASAALLASCSGGGETRPTPGPETVTVTPAQTAENNGMYCGPDGFKVEKGTIIVDGRCDLHPEQPVGMYEHAQQVQEQAVARAKTGAVLVAMCFENGEPISDASGKSSSRWIRVGLKPSNNVEMINPASKQADIPSIWTQGSDAVQNEC